jgi:hypothetical protein
MRGEAGAVTPTDLFCGTKTAENRRDVGRADPKTPGLNSRGSGAGKRQPDQAKASIDRDVRAAPNGASGEASANQNKGAESGGAPFGGHPSLLGARSRLRVSRTNDLTAVATGWYFFSTTKYCNVVSPMLLSSCH